MSTRFLTSAGIVSGGKTFEIFALLDGLAGIPNTVVDRYYASIQSAPILGFVLDMNIGITIRIACRDLALGHRLSRASHDQKGAPWTCKLYRTQMRPIKLASPGPPHFIFPPIASHSLLYISQARNLHGKSRIKTDTAKGTDSTGLHSQAITP
jgi:hypothetical protein